MGKRPLNSNRAARLAAIYELQRLGYLDDLSKSEIARRLGLGHRSSAGRLLRDIPVMVELIEEYKNALRPNPPLKEN